MLATRIPKNVFLLSLCQALGTTGNLLVMTVTALIGHLLAPPEFATLPIAFQFLAASLVTIPISYFMKNWGRKAGFFLGAISGCVGALINVFAIINHNFVAFCIGSFFFGMMAGIAQFYRYAAVDSAGEEYRSQTISLVLAGSILAALVGPELAKWSRNLVMDIEFVGTYLVVASLPLLTSLILFVTPIAAPSEEEKQNSGRSLPVLLRQGRLWVAVLGAVVGYASMTLLMVATPLAMRANHLVFNDVAFVIQWHVLGMYAPSLITGHLIRRWGVLNIMLLGAVFVSACILINLQGTSLNHFWWALFCLGVGWNFLFIGATTLLTYTYEIEERAKVQAFNELLVFSTTALAALFSGWLLHNLGWGSINQLVLIPIGLITLSILGLKMAGGDLVGKVST
ncbi:MAG: MFS transporter [SAR324 cluster bacterium]|uniref:MFS transporter n=1 Tax=SAR324 cluster bacterium TaxID=2024889 RepID=A0A2A4ST08_9DELT|nr:MAG: MFS transporter [SAR324 cluster bacterium]